MGLGWPLNELWAVLRPGLPKDSSWSRDHEDGGPTIQLPAAEFRCTLRSSPEGLSSVNLAHVNARSASTAIHRAIRA